MHNTQFDVKLRNPGDLIAAIPYLLGFWPTESVVICAHAGATGTQVQMCVRADLPPPHFYWELAEQVKRPVLQAKARAVTVIIVGEQDESLEPLPHQAQVAAITAVFADAGVPVAHALWTSSITEGAPWSCYDTMECGGRLPDPSISELAVASMADGTFAYESKDAMRAALQPTDRKQLAIRAERIALALAQRPDEIHARKLMDDVLAGIREGTFDLDEDRVVDLAVALSHSKVRDSCMRAEVTSLGVAIEAVWFELTRATPQPYRAEPASLLAFTAFLRGDGASAGVALEAAQDADPHHMVSHLLRAAMDLGLTPADLSRAIARGFANAGD
jgi:uncharacterized protein DUF4192